jgi:ABC-type polysaccharide/polyol phosphate export permease
VLYPLDIVPEPLRDLLALNPLAPLFELGRKWVVDPGAPEPVSVTNGTVWIPIAIFVGLCTLAVWVFRREAPRIAEEL